MRSLKRCGLSPTYSIFAVRRVTLVIRFFVSFSYSHGNDATCKRLTKYAGYITLSSLNQKYEPIMFSNEDIINKPVRIIGKVVELRGKL
jgi:hypothetical protein